METHDVKVYKAPEQYPKDGYKVFLAGSIEMGNCEDWQTQLTRELEEFDVTLLNPRRDDFDVTQEQSKNNPYFREQVEWELYALTEADLIVMYLDPSTKSPISLMELGLFKFKNIIVCCPDGFWRKGNVEIVCEMYGIQLLHNKSDLFEHCKWWIKKQI